MTANELALLALDDDMLNEYSLGELSDLLAEMRDSGELEDFIGDAFEAFAEYDESKHARADDGKFASKPGGGGGKAEPDEKAQPSDTQDGGKSKPSKSREEWQTEVDRLATEHAEATDQWETRSESRYQAKLKVEALDATASPDVQLDYPEGNNADELAASTARMQAAAERYSQAWQSSYGADGAVESTLLAAGAEESDLSRLRSIRDRGATVLARGVEKHGKALDALVEQRKKLDAAVAVPEPDQPDPEEYDDQEKFDRDTEKYEAAVEKREAKIDAAQERYQELEDRLNEIQADDIEYEFEQYSKKYGEELTKVKEKIAAKIDADQDKDKYPEEPDYPEEPEEEDPEEPDDAEDDEEPRR